MSTVNNAEMWMPKHNRTSYSEEGVMSFIHVGIADSKVMSADRFCAIYIWRTEPSDDGREQVKIENLIERLVYKYRLGDVLSEDLRSELQIKACELVHERWGRVKVDERTGEMLEGITSVGMMLNNIEQQLKREANVFVTRETSQGVVNENTKSGSDEFREAQEYYEGRGGVMVSLQDVETMHSQDVTEPSFDDDGEMSVLTKSEEAYRQWALNMAREQLSKQQKEVFCLRHDLRMPPEAVCKRLGMSRSAVDTNYSRAKDRLSELVKDTFTPEAYRAEFKSQRADEVRSDRPSKAAEFTVETRKKKKKVRKP